MNNLEATKLLKIGSRVQIWAESPDACTGTVTEKNWSAIKVAWDDGQTGAIHLNDLANVTCYHGMDKIVPKRKSITVAELLAVLQPLKDISPDLELKVWLPGSTITLAKNVFVRGGDSFLSIEGNVDPGSALDRD